MHIRSPKIYSIYCVMLTALLGCLESNNRDFSAEHYSENDTILVVAHRGSHSIHPENSLSAFNESIENGIDIIETDLRLTRDSIFVLLHDKTLDRTTTGNGPLKNFDFKEVENLNLRVDGKPTSEKIPTLEQALELTNNRILLNLDLKIQDLSTLKKLVKIIKTSGMVDSVIISIRDITLIPQIHKFDQDIRLMPVVRTRKKIRQVLKYDYIDIIQVHTRTYTSDLRKELKQSDLKIWVNALNKYDRLQEKNKTGFQELLQKKKVDIIQTDHPEELLDFLKKTGLHP